ncbi:pilus assembly protein PilP [Massilia arenosa]|uniref:Pilus assembly protein PilP n=1 Tax=Zemynaea arenosa TaxID=2561931 RepID=A0A4Y9SDX9_9BURK|nr:pilus assembly protein PilP [Massilia arenosa]TFW21062.1 pilus assembly protein PilP [Massilia arenosa]
MKTHAQRLAAGLAAAALLAGCSDSDVQQVRQWMAETRANTHVKVEPLSPPKTFIPYAYTAQQATDPFSQSKLLVELAKAAATSNNPFKPDLERRKELLESFPLDTMRMVGVLQKSGVTFALLQIDSNVYQVKVGQHIGQNYGLVTGVTENAVSIREVVQDAAGEWTERMAKLELQESRK